MNILHKFSRLAQKTLIVIMLFSLSAPAQGMQQQRSRIRQITQHAFEQIVTAGIIGAIAISYGPLVAAGVGIGTAGLYLAKDFHLLHAREKKRERDQEEERQAKRRRINVATQSDSIKRCNVACQSTQRSFADASVQLEVSACQDACIQVDPMHGVDAETQSIQHFVEACVQSDVVTHAEVSVATDDIPVPACIEATKDCDNNHGVAADEVVEPLAAIVEPLARVKAERSVGIKEDKSEAGILIDMKDLKDLLGLKKVSSELRELLKRMNIKSVTGSGAGATSFICLTQKELEDLIAEWEKDYPNQIQRTRSITPQSEAPSTQAPSDIPSLITSHGTTDSDYDSLDRRASNQDDAVPSYESAPVKYEQDDVGAQPLIHSAIAGQPAAQDDQDEEKYIQPAGLIRRELPNVITRSMSHEQSLTLDTQTQNLLQHSQSAVSRPSRATRKRSRSVLESASESVRIRR